MKNHPYTSSTFLKKWVFHFDKEEKAMRFNSIKGPVFLKKKFSPVHVNSGSNFTLQAYYKIIPTYLEELRKKVILVYDIPDYFEIHKENQVNFVKQYTIKEYVGYLIDLNNYNSIDSYLKQNFSSKSRSKFRSYLRKLENSFVISHKMFFGNISKEHYNYLMKEFLEISTKSFNIKKLSNRKLLPENFDFLKEVIYELILEKKANMFVVYNSEKPIGISINFNSDTVLFGDSTVFDPNYSKFNVGIIMLIKQIDWCINNNFKTYDFSKAYFPYKEKWCNVKYYFQHHIIYDSENIRSAITAFLLSRFLKVKQYLREHPLRYWITNNLMANKHQKYANYTVLKDDINLKNKIEISINSKKHPFIIKAVNDFLYTSSDHISEIKVFRLSDRQNTFCVQGKKTKSIIKYI